MPERSDAYQAALDFLYSFIDYSLTRNLRNAPEKFDLARMEALLAGLGNPHLAYPVIHVAGTKGKGSTAALAASALRAGGYKVGLY
ncbi:MAG: bifunctional folylpolyglutamate synthase/dihydrofolate synthase, partial [Chloroflexi bacterium]|nr:bifunctional folylpolyglutamate synthase/dihydrofolate synthase [Chloroflexota bacterium]